MTLSDVNGWAFRAVCLVPAALVAVCLVAAALVAVCLVAAALVAVCLVAAALVFAAVVFWFLGAHFIIQFNGCFRKLFANPSAYTYLNEVKISTIHALNQVSYLRENVFNQREYKRP